MMGVLADGESIDSTQFNEPETQQWLDWPTDRHTREYFMALSVGHWQKPNPIVVINQSKMAKLKSSNRHWYTIAFVMKKIAL